MSSTGIRPEYPRPQFKRKLWLNLNGDWDFEFDDLNLGEKEEWQRGGFLLSKKIVVPFCYQSKLSGIGEDSKHDVVWYKKTFELPESFKRKRAFINFGASDYMTKLWVNGIFVGYHKGGHVGFGFDITNYINSGENTLAVRVEDAYYDCTQPRGKQSWKDSNFGCWYTRTTGIWQTVWLEAVEDVYIERIKMTPDVDNRLLHIEAYFNKVVDNLTFQADIHFEGKFINRASVLVNKQTMRFSVDVGTDEIDFKVMLWFPGYPKLYDIKFNLFSVDKQYDEVESYFGMRKVEARDGKIYLNNRPYYQRLILDQGYFGDGLLTAESDELFVHDIKTIKEMGFNGLRKHQKIEDPRFLYWCDKLGMLVWAEMPSAYEFNDRAIENVLYEWQEAVKQQYNNPSIIVWTLLNESWGINEIASNEKQQSHLNSLYYMVKSYDASRLIVGNDGWEHCLTDILTIHDYIEDGDQFAKIYKNKGEIVNAAPSIVSNKANYAKGYSYKGQPIVISEYGGIAFNKSAGWGYGKKVTTEEEFIERFKKITHAIMNTDYICGFCYTQLTDVQQEVNGLMDEHHRVKFDVNRIREVVVYKKEYV